MTGRDLVLEIRQLWQIPSELDLAFTEASEVPHTIPQLVNGRLRVEVRGRPDREAVVFHEGAHVYLFHIGYPAAEPANDGKIPEFMLPPVDFLAEHYVLKLELEKRFSNQTERLEELRGRCNDAISHLPILGEHPEMQPGSGQLALQAAACLDLLTEWGAGADATQASKIVNASFNELIAIYNEALSAYQHAPRIPLQSRKFSRDEVERIKSILTSAASSVYQGHFTFKFL
jgi:hypothetical protein